MCIDLRHYGSQVSTFIYIPSSFLHVLCCEQMLEERLLTTAKKTHKNQRIPWVNNMAPALKTEYIKTMTYCYGAFESTQEVKSAQDH